MPTYVYQCKECGHGFEAQQSFSDAALTTCPECSGALRKVFNSVGVVFKGSGFYRTDSRSSSSATAPAAKSAETTGSSASTAAKADTPAAKPAAPAAGSGTSIAKGSSTSA